MIKFMRKTSLVKATMLTLVAGAALVGCTGCGGKATEQEKAQSQVPKDAMQKTYQDRAGKP